MPITATANSVRWHLARENDLYYRVLPRRDGLMTVATLQWFDEHDYDATRFASGSNGEPYLFLTEGEGASYLRDNYRPESIDPEFRSENSW